MIIIDGKPLFPCECDVKEGNIRLNQFLLFRTDFNNPNPAALIPAMASSFSLDSSPYFA